MFHHGSAMVLFFFNSHQVFLAYSMTCILLYTLQLVEVVKRGRPPLKADKRMTGSSTIDDVLQEVW